MAIRILGKLLFLHVPKTGGSWITHLLKNCYSGVGVARKHATRADYGATPIFTAAFVREPLSWYESYWRFRGGANSGEWNTHYGRQPHILDPIDRCGSPSFDTFLENCLEHAPSYLTGMYAAYCDHADFVGQYENLRVDTRKMLNIPGLVAEPGVGLLPPINVSEAARPKWNFDLRNRIIDSEAAVYARYYGGACSQR